MKKLILAVLIGMLLGITGLSRSFGEEPAVSTQPVESAAMTVEAFYYFQVDYSQSVEELVKQGGYDSIHPGINSENFPAKSTGTAEVELILVRLNKSMKFDGVTKELDKLGLQPAEIYELLTFGINRPEDQRKIRIFALGSFWQSRYKNTHFPNLWGYEHERGLTLAWFEGGWDKGNRFLAVKK